VAVALRKAGGIAKANIAGATIAAFGATFADMVVAGILCAVNTNFLGYRRTDRTNKTTDFHE
jgi:hypothetical protein